MASSTKSSDAGLRDCRKLQPRDAVPEIPNGSKTTFSAPCASRCGPHIVSKSALGSMTGIDQPVSSARFGSNSSYPPPFRGAASQAARFSGAGIADPADMTVAGVAQHIADDGRPFGVLDAVA